MQLSKIVCTYSSPSWQRTPSWKCEGIRVWVLTTQQGSQVVRQGVEGGKVILFKQLAQGEDRGLVSDSHLAGRLTWGMDYGMVGECLTTVRDAWGPSHGGLASAHSQPCTGRVFISANIKNRDYFLTLFLPLIPSPTCRLATGAIYPEILRLAKLKNMKENIFPLMSTEDNVK